MIWETPNPSISSASTSNKCLSLPIVGIVSTAMSSKTGFVEWHASRGGWVTYAQDFPKTWSGCDLIIGTSFGVPIKRGAIEAIGAVTPTSKGKEKRIKQEKLKDAEVEENAEGTKAGPEAQKRKTGNPRSNWWPLRKRKLGNF